jgi:hypothetical protein
MAEDTSVTSSARIAVPRGLNPREAAFLLDVFAGLKVRRFGRLELTVSDGRLMDVEVVERIDRKLFPPS